MGAPMGNRNAAGNHKGRGSKQPSKWVSGKRIGYKKMKARVGIKNQEAGLF